MLARIKQLFEKRCAITFLSDQTIAFKLVDHKKCEILPCTYIEEGIQAISKVKISETPKNGPC